MSTLLSSGRLWLLSFVSAFLISLIKLILWLKFSTDKRQAEDTEWQGPQGAQNQVSGPNERGKGKSESLCQWRPSAPDPPGHPEHNQPATPATRKNSEDSFLEKLDGYKEKTYE